MAAANYHGECICARKDCALKAYYKQSGKPFCGRHSAQPARTKLPVNPDKDKNLALAFANHMLYVEAHRVDNVALGERGTVICCKMTMFQGQQPVFVDGYINVFANYKHANRYGGLGMPDLSPKSMGPVEHPQPGLPPSKNLENFHQFSKRFPGETMKEFREAQRKAFADPEPHRHKPQALKQKGNKNIPKYWVWTCPDGTVLKKTYIQCRQFYCNYYDRFASESDSFAKLCQLLDQGYNLRICGYDGFMPDKTHMEHYQDDSRPFGHEMVLYTMLTETEENWPWRKMKTEEF